jgi:hypothetical protein
MFVLGMVVGSFIKQINGSLGNRNIGSGKGGRRLLKKHRHRLGMISLSTFLVVSDSLAPAIVTTLLLKEFGSEVNRAVGEVEPIMVALIWLQLS